MIWYVYLLRCRDGSLYCGITNDPVRRLAAHQSGRGSKYTRSRRPVEWAYLSPCGSPRVARRRERQIKGWTKAQKEAYIRRDGPRD